MNKFKAAQARALVAEVLHSRLAGATYNADKMSVLARDISDEIKQRLKGVLGVCSAPAACSTCRPTLNSTWDMVADAGWPRYKYAVQVWIGEQRGEGCRWV